jgi:hypothetical protein
MDNAILLSLYLLMQQNNKKTVVSEGELWASIFCFIITVAFCGYILISMWRINR